MKLLFAAAIAIATSLQSTSTYAQTLTVFATSETYTGNLSGVSGANFLCQSLADAASLPGTFRAWISEGITMRSPANSFARSTVPYQLAGGPTIANDFADLIDGTLQNPINRDENGDLISGNFDVWTGTNIDGTNVGSDCDNWRTNSGSFSGRLGNTNASGRAWTGTNSQNKFCNLLARLYCFQQDIPTSAPSKAPSNAPTLSKSGKSSTTKASKDMSAKSGKSVKASKNEGLDFNELALLIVAIFFVFLQGQDSDGSMLGALLEGIQAKGGIHGRRILEDKDKEDLKALFVSLLEEKMDMDEY